MTNDDIGLVIFDLAGTTVDYGCIAPLMAFIKGFRMMGITITPAQARAPMGMEKRAHIRAIAAQPEVARQWQKIHGRSVDAADIDAMYDAFTPLILKVLPQHCDLIPGTLETVNELNRVGIPFAATTGYFDEATDIIMEQTAEAGFSPHAHICATRVSAGRPAPWMIYHCMESLNVYPPPRVINVGDTPADVASGRNAGVWSVGVAASGNQMGLSVTEMTSMDSGERHRRLLQARQSLLAAGAHYVIDTVAHLPELIRTIEQRLVAGERP